MAHAAQQARSPHAAPLPPVAGLRAWLAWGKANRLKAGLAGGLALLIATAHLALYRILVRDDEIRSLEPLPTLDEALEALRAGHYAEARYLARRLDARRDISMSEPGKFHSICGLAAAREADESLLADERRRLFAIATQHLQEARQSDLSAEGRREVLMWLGKSLLANGHETAARRALGTALAESPEQAPSLHLLLATALAHGEAPNDAEALIHLNQYLKSSQLTGEALFDVWVEQARLLVRLGRTADARRALAEIPSAAPQRAAAQVVLGRALMRDAEISGAGAAAPADARLAGARDQLAQAITTFREAQAEDATDRRVARQSMYLIGVCQERLAQHRDALEQFDRTQRQFYELGEGFAACVAQARLHHVLGEDAEAVAAWQRAGASPGRQPEPGEEIWLTDSQFEAAVSSALRYFIGGKNFDAALALCGVLATAGKREQALETAADARAQWSRELLRDAAMENAESAEAVRRRARDLMRAAASDFVELARLRFTTRRYTEHVGQAAAAYLAGGDYDRAVEQLSEFLEYESGPSVPKALVDLGEAELSRGNPDAAIRALEKCLELYPNDPAIYRGRLLAGKAFEERGDRAKAIEVLEQNLTGRLTPASPEWRDAIFAEGRLLYNQAVRLESESRSLDAKGLPQNTAATKMLESAVEEFQRAIARLSEAVERYPGDPQALASRYMIAQAYRYSARLPQRRLRKITIHQQQALLNREAQRALEASLAQYTELQGLLNRQQESSLLSPLNATMLRNCYFAIGSILFELGQNDRALEAYRATANAYQNFPEAMNAYFQIAACQRRRNELDDARATLEQARVVLSRIAADDKAFVAATAYSRQEWEKLLTWMTRL
jgi:tetratricopeptide (TPR) repeat protein